MQPLSTTLPRKVTASYTAPPGRGISFGDAPTRTMSPIEALAASDGGYSAELAYLMSIISAWAYSDEKVLGAKLKYYGFGGAHLRRVTVQNNALLVVTTAYLIQSENGKVAVLAFRGTDPGDFVTVLTDTQVMQRPFSGGNVHAGFYASVEVVWDEIHEALAAARNAKWIDADGNEEPLQNPLESLYITGHSLGGAMAMLAAARLFGRGYEDWHPESLLKAVYTFGQPMVGDRAFADSCESHFGSRLYRHVFNNDFVPHLPPHTWMDYTRSGLDYAHSGGEWRATETRGDWTHTNHASGRAPLVRGSSLVLLNALEARTTTLDMIPGYSVDDHMPSNYLEATRHAFDPAASRVPARPASIAESVRRRVQGAVSRIAGAF